MKFNLLKYEKHFLVLVLVFLLSLSLLYTLSDRFDHDEVEHTHAAWLLTQGKVPYRDYYENHHPLYWFVLMPFIKIIGESMQTLVFFKLLSFWTLLGILYLVYLLTKELKTSIKASYIAVAALLSCHIFIDKATEIRPDGLQILLVLISVLYFLKKDYKTSGLLFGVSFLVLQKSIFLLPAFIIVFLIYKDYSKLKEFSLWFLLPCGILLFYLIVNGAVEDYVINNILVNLNYSKDTLWENTFDYTYNIVFWLLGLAAIVYGLRYRRDRKVMVLSILTITSLASLFILRFPARQYFLQYICFSSILVAYMLTKVKLKTATYLVLLILLTVPMTYHLTRQALSLESAIDYMYMDMVLTETEPTEKVYDAHAKFNVFRPDLHYMWFSTGEGGLAAYNKVTNGRYSDYDTCKLIREYKPAFTTEHCNIQDYKPTIFKDLYTTK